MSAEYRVMVRVARKEDDLQREVTVRAKEGEPATEWQSCGWSVDMPVNSFPGEVSKFRVKSAEGEESSEVLVNGGYYDKHLLPWVQEEQRGFRHVLPNEPESCGGLVVSNTVEYVGIEHVYSGGGSGG